MRKLNKNQRVNMVFSGLDYYSRKVVRHNKPDISLLELIDSAKYKLSTLLVKKPEVTELIEDMDRINRLKSIDIPQEDGSLMPYCVLEKAKQGNTEKILLIQLDTVKKRLQCLNAAVRLSPEIYLRCREKYQLKAEAVLKLPKQDSILEIHHTALALNLARILGLHTPSFALVSYLSHPALFISEESFEYLDAVETEFTAEGLQADGYLDDLGNGLAFLYLCNEAGRNLDRMFGLLKGKKLNVVNPSIHPTPKLVQFSDIEEALTLDASLSIHPTMHDLEIDRKCRRIDDSSMQAKFQSLWNAYQLSTTIIKNFDNLAKEMQIRELLLYELPQSFFNVTIKNELKDLTILKADLALISSSIKARLTNIERLFTANNIGGALDGNGIRQVFILEKLLHLPVLFTHDGQPYRYPWIDSPINTIQSVVKTNGHIVITFQKQVNTLIGKQLIVRGLKSMQWAGNSVKISRQDLGSITENLLYPESNCTLLAKDEYLCPEDLLLLCQAYGERSSAALLNLFDSYAKQIANTKTPVAEKLQIMIAMQTELYHQLERSANKGLIKHLLRKFHFSMQFQLQKLMGSTLPELIHSAFAVAVKLDRLAEFNKVVLFAVVNNHVQDRAFIEFLHFCSNQEKNCSNYVQAKQQSNLLYEYAERQVVPILQSANDAQLEQGHRLKINTIL